MFCACEVAKINAITGRPESVVTISVQLNRARRCRESRYLERTVCERSSPVSGLATLEATCSACTTGPPTIAVEEALGAAQLVLL